MIAAIIFDQTTHHLDIGSLCKMVTELGYRATPGEWRYLTGVVPQVEIQTNPPIALMLNDHSDVVEELDELLEDEFAELSTEDTARFQACNARVEVVSGKQPTMHRLPEGGVASYTEPADISQHATQELLAAIAARLHGFLWLNQ